MIIGPAGFMHGPKPENNVDALELNKSDPERLLLDYGPSKWVGLILKNKHTGHLYEVTSYIYVRLGKPDRDK